MLQMTRGDGGGEVALFLVLVLYVSRSFALFFECCVTPLDIIGWVGIDWKSCCNVD
jgi:hypothetical protein